MIQGAIPAEFAQWEDVIDLFGSSKIIALKKDGTLLALGKHMDQKYDIAEWKVPVHKSEKYLKHIEQMEFAKEQELASEKERLAEEHAATIERKILRLKKERAALKAELPTVTGLFAGKRRREIEDRLDAIRQELRRLNPDQ